MSRIRKSDMRAKLASFIQKMEILNQELGALPAGALCNFADSPEIETLGKLAAKFLSSLEDLKRDKRLRAAIRNF